MTDWIRRPSARVSHDLCIGTAMCTNLAPAAFRLNNDGQSEFQPEGAWKTDELYAAADGCPMSAITVADHEDGPPA